MQYTNNPYIYKVLQTLVLQDPVGNVLKEWFALHTNAGGVVSLSYRLNRLFPRYGEWTIEVSCLNHIYTKMFAIDEFCTYGAFVFVFAFELAFKTSHLRFH